MTQEKTALLDRLTTLIGDLRSLPGASPKQLEQARIAVARAIAADQREAVIRVASVQPTLDPREISAEHRASLESAVDSVIAQPATTPEFLVARREVPLSVTGLQHHARLGIGASDRLLHRTVRRCGRPPRLDRSFSYCDPDATRP